MKYIEEIPPQLQIMYNCDYLEWNPEMGMYQLIQYSPYAAGVYVIDYALYDEIQSALADIEEDLLREAEYWADIKEDIAWQRKNC